MFDALANQLAFGLLRLDPESEVGAAVRFFIMDVAKIFVLLVAIIYIMGLLRAMLSPERVREFVRDRPDWQARGLAVTLGAGTPFCSCSSVPLFIGFVEAGIPLGVTFSFLIASPMINEVAAVILVGILGWELAILYLAAGLLVAWFGGIAMQVFRSNATGVIPVAEAMLTKGVAEGTTLALTMSVSALSLPEMLILRKVIRWQALALFAGVLAIAFTLVGWGFNLCLSGTR